MRVIDNLLRTPRAPPAEILVNSKREVYPTVCSLVPPNTIKNRFADVIPKLDFEPILGSDMRGVFLTHMPVTDRFGLGRGVKSMMLKPLSSRPGTTMIKSWFFACYLVFVHSSIITFVYFSTFVLYFRNKVRCRSFVAFGVSVRKRVQGTSWVLKRVPVAVCCRVMQCVCVMRVGYMSCMRRCLV